MRSLNRPSPDPYLRAPEDCTQASDRTGLSTVDITPPPGPVLMGRSGSTPALNPGPQEASGSLLIENRPESNEELSESPNQSHFTTRPVKDSLHRCQNARPRTLRPATASNTNYDLFAPVVFKLS
ncbi:unnamed protein product [Arctogadus glacialis]